MRYLLVTIFGLFSLQSIAQSNKDPLHLFDSTKKDSRFDSVYADIKGAISGLATGLKTTGDHVYGVMVYQQKVKAVVWAIISVPTLILILFCIRGWRHGCLDKNNDLTFKGVKMIYISAIAVIFAFGCLSNFETMITGFLNPEYGALQEILKAI